MIKLKGCPKCQGDQRMDEDEYGKRLVCWQCGKEVEVPMERYAPYAPIPDEPLVLPDVDVG